MKYVDPGKAARAALLSLKQPVKIQRGGRPAKALGGDLSDPAQYYPALNTDAAKIAATKPPVPAAPAPPTPPATGGVGGPGGLAGPVTQALIMAAADSGSANGATGSGGDSTGGVSGSGGVGGAADGGAGGSAAAGTSGDAGGDGTYKRGGTVDELLRQARSVKAAGGSLDDSATLPQRDLTPLGFYSHGAEVAASLPQLRASPDQFKAALTNRGVKPDEFKWSNYDRAFTGQKSITRDQLVQHFKGGLPKIGEVNTAADDPRLGDNTRYSQYQLPGGKNYREVLLHLPEQVPAQTRSVHRLYRDGQLTAEGDERGAERWRQRDPNADVRVEDVPDTRVATNSPWVSQNYSSSHWDLPNVLAHLRLSDRKDGKKKILHVEELQSDWAQEGRKKGFIGDVSPQQRALEHEREQLANKVVDIGQDHPEYMPAMDRITAINTELKQPYGAPSGLPAAPYVDSTAKWLDLGLKRVLHEAAKGGYDRVVVTPGQEQADRYDLSKKLKNITYTPAQKFLQGQLADSGKPGFTKEGVEPEHLPDLVGKEVADRLLKSPLRQVEPFSGVHHRLEGLDLRVGGEGMKSFYDKMLPQALEKLARKHDPGAKLSKHSIVTAAPTDRMVGSMKTDLHALDITPKMRASILRGHSAYADGGAVKTIIKAVHEHDRQMHGDGKLTDLHNLQKTTGRPATLKNTTKSGKTPQPARGSATVDAALKLVASKGARANV